MTWDNAVRRRRKAQRLARWHEARIADAPTEKRKLAAACDWLRSEAWKADRLEEARRHVMEKIREIRGEEVGDDRDSDHTRGYAA